MITRATLFAAALCVTVAPAWGADETTTLELKSLKLTVPKTWKQQEPANRMRLTQFELPAATGDAEPAELVVFHFPGGGDIDANIRRWVNQFQPEGREEKITQGKSEQGNYYLVEVSGTYNKPIGPPIQQKSKAVPGSRMLSVILVTADKNVYYLKLTGYDKTVKAAATPFRTSFGGNAEKETAYAK